MVIPAAKATRSFVFVLAEMVAESGYKLLDDKSVPKR